MRTAFCFDLDGTVTTTEILPCLASHLGVTAEIATLTRITMDGVINFEESLRLRCLILGTIPLPIVHEIIDAVPLSDHILKFLHSRREDCFIVTGNLDIWIEKLARRCGVKLYSSKAQLQNNRVILDKVLEKSSAIRELRATGRFDRIVAIGDGANDVPMLREADIRIAFGGVHKPAPTVIQEADYVIHDASSLCHMLKGL